MNIINKIAIARTKFKESNNKSPARVAISYSDARELIEISLEMAPGVDKVKVKAMLKRDNREEIINHIESATIYGMKIVVVDISTIGVNQ
jgi:hypothetical protein